MAKFRQAKSRILHGNLEDGFASPIFDVRLALRQLEKERKVELARLYREFHGLDPDPFNAEFEKFEKLLNEKYHGDTDNLYRIEYGFKNGKPNKLSEYVDYQNGKLVHASVCAKCGRRLVDGECPVCSKKSDDWLRIG